MSTKEELINEIEEAPEPLLSEVLDFVHFLKAKTLYFPPITGQPIKVDNLSLSAVKYRTEEAGKT